MLPPMPPFKDAETGRCEVVEYMDGGRNRNYLAAAAFQAALRADVRCWNERARRSGEAWAATASMLRRAQTSHSRPRIVEVGALGRDGS